MKINFLMGIICYYSLKIEFEKIPQNIKVQNLGRLYETDEVDWGLTAYYLVSFANSVFFLRKYCVLDI